MIAKSPPPLAEAATLARVASLCRLLTQSPRPPSLAELARHAGWSPTHTHRVFTRTTGVTPREYAAGRRREAVQDALARGDGVARAMYGAGYESSGRFYEDAPRMLGMTPRRYRAGGEAEVIRFAVGACSLGAVLVAATDEGLCAISLGHDPEALVHALEHRFARATLEGGDAAFEGHVAAVVGLIERPELDLRLPLDVRGTAFQERVWRALTDVPPGTTITYAELARRIGAPAAVRAVAGACAANPLAVAIPCHRVVRTDGGLSGYRWGVERKHALLARERGLLGRLGAGSTAAGSERSTTTPRAGHPPPR